MTTNNQNIFNLILKFAVDHGKSSFELDDFYNENPDRVKDNDIQALKQAKRLLELKKDKTIVIKTKSSLCRHFSKQGSCYQEILKKECKFFHICPNEIERDSCQNVLCTLNHSLNTDHNRLIFEKEGISDQIDMELVFKSMKIFNLDTITSPTNRFSYLNDMEAGLNMIKQSSSQVKEDVLENRTIEIDITDEYCIDQGEAKLQKYFSKMKQMNIEDALFLPKFKKAFITYFNSQIAQQIAEKTSIEFFGTKFRVRLHRYLTPDVYDSRVILLKHLPMSLSFKEIKDYVQKLTSHQPYRILVSEKNGQDCILCFKTKIDYNQIVNNLKRPCFQFNKKIEAERVLRSTKITIEKNIGLRGTSIKISEDEIKRLLINSLNKIAKIELDKKVSNKATVYFNYFPDDRIFDDNFNASYKVIPIFEDFSLVTEESRKKPNDIVKEFDRKLSILNENIEWRKNFHEIIKSLNGKVIERYNSLVIKCTLDENSSNYYFLANKWDREISKKLNDILAEYDYKEIKLNNENRENLIKDIKYYGNSLIYELDTSSELIVLVGKTSDLNEFMKKMDLKLAIDIKDLIVPHITINEINLFKLDDLLNPLLKIVKEKFNLERLFYQDDERKVTAKGKNASIDEAFNLINEYLNNIDMKILESQSPDLLINENMSKVIKNLLYQLDIKCKIELLFEKKSSSRPGIYLVYFKDFVGIDPFIKEFSYKVESIFKSYFESCEIELSKIMSLLDSNEWKGYYNEKFGSQEVKFRVVHYLRHKQNSSQLLLFGQKDLVLALKEDIKDFIKKHETMKRKLSFSSKEISYLKVIYSQIEAKLKEYNKGIKIEFSTKIEWENKFKDVVRHEAMLLNCPNNYYDTIFNIILTKCSNLKESQIQFNHYPGFVKLFSKSNEEFNKDVLEIERNTNTAIDYSVTENIDFTMVNQVQEVTYQDSELSLSINNSKIELIFGDILQLTDDIIVNSSSPSLNLNHGQLSKKIFEKAGHSIQVECQLKYPNGINQGEVAISSTGSFKNYKYIYHVTVGSFNNSIKDQLASNLKKSIKSCLQELKINNLSSICFPTLGAGGFGYPADLVAKIMFESSTEFLVNNPQDSFKIKFVIFNNDSESEKEFKNEIKRQKSSEKFKKTIKKVYKRPECSTKLKAEFYLITDQDKNLILAKESLRKLIENKFILTHIVTKEYFQHFTQEKLQILFKKNDDIEVTLDKNGDLSITGYRDDVQKEKDEIMSLIVKTNAEFHAKIIQNDLKYKWEYQNNDEEWKPFNLFLNSLIEEAYQDDKEKLDIPFKINRIAYVNLRESIMAFEYREYFLRRRNIDEQKMSDLPKTWSKMHENELFKLVVLQENSEEYIRVVNNFTTSFGRIIRVERVQNARLYQQYEIHKLYLKKKNSSENEKILFHGTSNTNISSICKFGFNRSYCGVNGVAYGKGVYFALNSSYSHGYTSGSPRQMFQCRVLVGESVGGNSSMNVPPNKSNGEPYDSTCDSSGTIFVCYNDNQCYPDYLITYL